MSAKDPVEPHVFQDKEILGDKANLSHEEAMHFGVLTPEELETEKHLKRKIDSLIMPMVVLVYLVCRSTPNAVLA
jgi:hypothetical protein